MFQTAAARGSLCENLPEQSPAVLEPIQSGVDDTERVERLSVIPPEPDRSFKVLRRLDQVAAGFERETELRLHRRRGSGSRCRLKQENRVGRATRGAENRRRAHARGNEIRARRNDSAEGRQRRLGPAFALVIESGEECFVERDQVLGIVCLRERPLFGRLHGAEITERRQPLARLGIDERGSGLCRRSAARDQILQPRLQGTRSLPLARGQIVRLTGIVLEVV